MKNNTFIGDLIKFGFIEENCTLNDKIALYLGCEYKIMGDDIPMRHHLILHHECESIKVIDERIFSHATELVS